jgi:DNA-directed RNA polymerase specialized sigma24 family protein
MSKRATLKWPPLDITYTDEFGDIDSEVYRAAGDLWPDAEAFALKVLHDSAAGLRLLLKAAAAVSRIKGQPDHRIDHLAAYLFQTYKRLVLAQAEKENARRLREAEKSADMFGSYLVALPDLEQRLYVEEVVGRMDQWTSMVFGLLVIGLTFEEIGRALELNPHTARIKFRRQCRKIAGQLGDGLKASD